MPRGQCTSVHHTPGSATFIFCLKKPKHKGDHRGTGRQWNQKGERVKITEQAPK